jgi:hypothetical protein
MRILLGFGSVLILALPVCAQFRNPTPVMTGGFGNVVYPGGTSATVPGIQRFNYNVVYPGGGGPRLNVPFSAGSSRTGGGNRGGTLWVPYVVPFYVGGYGYGYGDTPADPAAQQPQQQQPNVTVVYPPQPAPVIINQYGSGGGEGPTGQAQPAAAEAPPQGPYMPSAEDSANSSTGDTSPYLIAFKDHSIYSAVAYWVDGDTLHYFTSGNTHNQISLELVDRDLTERLNKEAGREMNLPPAK